MGELRGGSTINGLPVVGRNGTQNYIPKMMGNALENSLIYDNGSQIQIKNGNTGTALHVENTSSNGTVLELRTSGDGNSLLLQSDHILTSSNPLHVGTDTINTYVRGVNIGIGTTSPSTSHGVSIAGGLKVAGNSHYYNVGRFVNDSGISIESSTSEIAGLQVYQPSSTGDALMTFHVGGDYAVHFGLDGSVNDLVVGGWSMGANKYRMFHQGNQGKLRIWVYHKDKNLEFRNMPDLAYSETRGTVYGSSTVAENRIGNIASNEKHTGAYLSSLEGSINITNNDSNYSNYADAYLQYYMGGSWTTVGSYSVNLSPLGSASWTFSRQYPERYSSVGDPVRARVYISTTSAVSSSGNVITWGGVYQGAEFHV